jgi:hypothetical protein
MLCALLFNNIASNVTAEPITSSIAEDDQSSSLNSLESGWVELRIDPADLAGHWAERVFQWAVRLHIIEGYPDKTFRPDHPVSEVEFLKIFYKAFGYPRARILDEDWMAAPYRLAKYWNHPVTSNSDSKNRLEPITRRHAAEIIAAAQGVQFDGDDAISYLFGRSLANGKTTANPEGFAGNDLLTRAETIQWIRTLQLQGIYDIKERPREPSDRSLIQDFNSKPKRELPDFVMNEIDLDDLYLADSKKDILVPLGSTKDYIKLHYGDAARQDVFDNDTYGPLAVHYDSDGKLDGWSVMNDVYPDASFQTGRGIVLGQSMLQDVLTVYGTAGYYRTDYGINCNYLYELVGDRIIPRFSHKEILNQEQAYILTFSFDEETLKVNYMYVSSYRKAFLSN